jgi:predicted metal-dependent hydrolase
VKAAAITHEAGYDRPTPPALAIEKRDVRLDLAGRDVRRWHPDGLHVAHFWNALSIFFPEGEKLFIESVRHFRDRIRSPSLASEVAAFVGQEAVHSREHRRYNAVLAEAGLPVERLEERLRSFLAGVKRRASPIKLLAVTIALEHYTAIMAGHLLDDDQALEGADERFAALWRWHAIEETEHKAVAYDLFDEVTQGARLGYVLRAVVMLVTTLIFWGFVFRYHFALVRADGGLTDVRGWGRLLRFLWVRPGVLRKIFRPWLTYFRRDFHPWQHDNHAHVEAWKAAYAERGYVIA